MTLPASASAHHQPQIIQQPNYSVTVAANNKITTTSSATIQQQLQPPLPHQYATISANSKLKKFNNSYLLAHNLIPRRQSVFSTSRITEVNYAKPMQERIFDRNNFQQQLSMSGVKKAQKEMTKISSNYRSSECISPSSDQFFKNPKQEILRFIRNKSDENILNRKSAFKPVNPSCITNASITTESSETHSSGASSTTSSILNSVSNSTSFSKLSNECSGSQQAPKVVFSASNCKHIPESIRSGSVSSARSIYELRLKSLNESNHQALVTSTHSQRLHSSSSAHKIQTQQVQKPERNFQSVKLDKHPRRRTHLSDNDYLQAIKNSATKSSPFFKADKLANSLSSSETSKFQANFLKFQSNSSKLLQKFLLDDTNESLSEKNKNLANAQRRLSYNNFRTQAQEQYNKYPNNRKSICIETGFNEDKQLLDDDLILDINDYDEDDDIFEDSCVQDEGVVFNGVECEKHLNSLSIGSGTTESNSLSTTASSSSSLASNVSDNLLKQQKNAPIKQVQAKWQNQMMPSMHLNQPQLASACALSTKSFLSSTTTNSSSSMSPSSYAKPPQTPKSPCSPSVKTNSNVFNFNLPISNSPQELRVSTSVRRSSINAPPPLPSQSTQLTNLSQINFTIVPSLQFFSHFDVQSIFFNYDRVKLIKEALQLSINIRTGATAARHVNTNNAFIKEIDGKINTPLVKTSRSGINSISSILGSMEQSSSSVDEASIAGDIVKESASRDKNCNSRYSTSLLLYMNEDISLTGSLKKREDPELAGRRLSKSVTTKLVEECPFFRVEVGGDVFKGLGLCGDASQRRMMKLNSLSILDRVNSFYNKEIIEEIEANMNQPFMLEFQDWGAYYYRFYFSGKEHSNYLGIDDNVGPCAISIKREKLLVENRRNDSTNTVVGNEKAYEYVYRLIFRSSDLNTLRGTILEDHIISKHPATSKGLPHKDVIGYLFPDLDLTKLNPGDSKVTEKLLALDESCLVKTHKIGVLLCKSGQSTEEEMYNNKDSTPAFDEFLELLGDKVVLKGFPNYRGGLDIIYDTASTHSVYTKFRDKEIMFHVSTMLPYSTNDRQQVTRKRHIGNDLVTIIFQEPGALPFSPRMLRSHFQHVFIVVRVVSNPGSTQTHYSVAISYSTDVPSFGPPLPKNPLFAKSKEFRDFLLAKIVNADAAGLKCEKFMHIKMRAQQGTLRELYHSHTMKKMTLANCNNAAQKFGLFNFGSVKTKKTRSKSLQMFSSLLSENEKILAGSLALLNGCVFWNVDLIEDFQYTLDKNCYFGISKQFIVAVDSNKKSVLLCLGCSAIIGWTINDIDTSILIYFDQGECFNVRFTSPPCLNQVVKRLECFTRGCHSTELSLAKKDYGPLGFSIHHDGVISDVYHRELKPGTRIVKINDYFLISLSNEMMMQLLRRPGCLKLTFLPPLEDGTVRRGQDESYSLYSYLTTFSSPNERLIDSIRTPPPHLINRSYFSQPIAAKPHMLPLSNTSNSRLLQARSNQSSRFDDLSNDFEINKVKKSRKSSQILISRSQENEIDALGSMSGSVNTNYEWTKLVQSATNAYDEAMRGLGSCSMSSSMITGNKEVRQNSSRNYISTKEIIENKPDIFKGIKNDFFLKEKKISYEELKDTFIQVQLELNQEKQEKLKVSSNVKKLLKENMNLKQTVNKLMDENNKLIYQQVYGSSSNSTKSSNSSSNSFKENRTFSSEASLKLNQELQELKKDSSV